MKNALPRLLLVVLPICNVLAQTNLLQNGSFEQNPGVFMQVYPGSTALPGWTIEAGNIDLTSSEPGRTVQDGNWLIDLDGFYQAGTISQAFVTTPGRSYSLSFYMSGNPGGHQIKEIEVTVAGKVQVFRYDVSTGHRWDRWSLTFQASGNTETLRIRSLSPSGSAFGAFLDNFVIVPANLLTNGSFEQNPGVFMQVYPGSTALPGWTIEAGNIDLTTSEPGRTVKDGNWLIDLDGFYQAGTISQTFATTPGQKYSLSFYISGNPGGHPIKEIEVTVAGQVRRFQYDTATGHRWDPCNLTFQASGNSETLRIRSLSPASSAFGAFLDDFVVVPLDVFIVGPGNLSIPPAPDQDVWIDYSTEYKDSWVFQTASTEASSMIFPSAEWSSGPLRLAITNVSTVKGSIGAARATKTHIGAIRIPLIVPEDGVFTLDIAGFSTQLASSIMLSGIGLARSAYTITHSIRVVEKDAAFEKYRYDFFHHESIPGFGSAVLEASMQVFSTLFPKIPTLGKHLSFADLASTGLAAREVLRSGRDGGLEEVKAMAVSADVQLEKNKRYYIEIQTQSFTFAELFSATGGWDLMWVDAAIVVEQLTLNRSPSNKTAATVELGALLGKYDGTPKPATATTTPTGLNVVLTYNGSSVPPVTPGVYAVTATVSDANYAGTASGTKTISIPFVVRHAPVVNGSLDGSVQMLTGEPFFLKGSAWISGDLLVAGTPSVQVVGTPTFGGSIDGPGGVSPSSYLVTIADNSLLRRVVRRVDSTPMPLVSSPPEPVGVRVVSLTNPSQSPGDFATIRNLSLSGSAGIVKVPPGTYGSFSASGNSGFELGIPNSTVPVVYNFQSLALNLLPGIARLQIVGPVVVNLASGALLNGNVGSQVNPDWLDLRLAGGGLTIGGNVRFNGHVVAPNSTVTLNVNAMLYGRVVADRLVINGTSAVVDPNR